MRRMAAVFVVLLGAALSLVGPAPAGAQQTVTAGALCSPEGDTGQTTTGLEMICTKTADDEQARWREAQATPTTDTPTTAQPTPTPLNTAAPDPGPTPDVTPRPQPQETATTEPAAGATTVPMAHTGAATDRQGALAGVLVAVGLLLAMAGYARTGADRKML